MPLIRYTMTEFSLIDFVFNWLRLKWVIFIGIYRLSCSYEISVAQITVEFRRNSQCLAWFDAVEFNRLPSQNAKMYDDEVFADRFCYQLTMLEIRVLVRQSRLLHAHIAYEIDVGKITAEICRIYHCLAWFDAVEFNCLPRPNDKMYDDEVFPVRFRYQLTMFQIRILIGLSRHLHGHIAYEIVLPKITTDNMHDVRNDLRCRIVLKP